MVRVHFLWDEPCGSPFLALIFLPLSNSDLREILPPSVLTKTFLQAVARAYHSQRGVIVTVAGAKVSWVVTWKYGMGKSPFSPSPLSLSLPFQVLLHKLGEVDEGYLDPKNKQILMVDARAEVRRSDSGTYQLPHRLLADRRSPLLLPKVVSTDNDNGKTLMTATSEPARVELEQAVAHYVAANYATEAVSWIS